MEARAGSVVPRVELLAELPLVLLPVPVLLQAKVVRTTPMLVQVVRLAKTPPVRLLVPQTMVQTTERRTLVLLTKDKTLVPLTTERTLVLLIPERTLVLLTLERTLVLLTMERTLVVLRATIPSAELHNSNSNMERFVLEFM